MPFPARGEFVKLGKGSILLDLLTDAGVATGYQFMGNATAVEISSEINQVELYESTRKSAGLLARDKTRISFQLAVTLSEFELNNLKLYLQAEQTSRAQNVGTGVSVQLDNVTPGRRYDLGSRQITNVSVDDGSDVLVAGTDYEINAEFGVLHVLEGGAVTQDSDLVVTFDRPALTIDVLRIGQGSKQVAHLLYLSDDVNTDSEVAKDRLEIWRADVAPEGALNLIGDDYGSFQLTMAVLTDGTNHPNDPYGTLERVRA